MWGGSLFNPRTKVVNETLSTYSLFNPGTKVVNETLSTYTYGIEVGLMDSMSGFCDLI